MAAGPNTQVADIIVPEIFNQYIQQETERKDRLIQSGAVVMSPLLSSFLNGGGLTFNMPSFKDLDQDDDNVATDTASDQFTGGSDDSAPKKIETANEIAVRLNRNQNWGASMLAGDLAGDDPLDAIQNRVVKYWLGRRQAIFKATITGIFADNAAAPGGSEHVQNDMTNDITGASFIDGVTNFNSKGFLGAKLTMGDSGNNLTMLMVHSVVFNTMENANLIDFIPDARGEIDIPTYLGREVIVDDDVPFSGAIYESWLFGPGAVLMGVGTHKRPVSTDIKEDAGNGDGQEVLYNRNIYSYHPIGNAYVGTAPSGGPSNAATSNNLAAAGSWQRRYTERKQIPIARLLTRES